MDPNLPAPGNSPQPNTIVTILHHPKILVGALGAIALFISIFLFFSLRRESPSATKEKSVGIQPQVTQAPRPSFGEQESVYQDESLRVDFPDDWEYELNGLASESGTLIYMTPKDQDPGETIPNLSISYDTNPTPLEDRVRMYEGYGYRRGIMTVENIVFIKVSGTAQDRVENDELVEKPIQVTYAFAKVNGQMIVINYVYDGDQVNPQMENFFKGIIDTVQFQNQNQ